MAQTIKLKRSAVAGRIPNVSDLELGEIAINTYDGKMYIKKSVNGEESISEIGQDANLGAVFTSYTFTATANQTVFTGNDNSGNALDIVDEFSNVFMNGILLDPEIDFTVSSDGLTLTLTEPAEADDILQINSFDQAIFNGTLNVDALALTGMAGEMVWNSDEETIDVPLNDDVTLQLGQEFVFRGKATEAISNGDVVMFAGAQGGHLLIAKADMSSVGFAPEYVIGIATQDFNTNDFGFVTELGKVRGLDTSGYSEGDILYLDPTTAGALTVTKPTPPSHAIQMCAVVRSHGTQGTLLVRPTHTSDTDEIAEGSSNLYFTVARAVAAIKADGDWNASDWDTAFGWGDHSTEGYLTSVAFNDLTSTPTTISGYGITDAFDGAYSSLTGKPTLFSGSYTDLTNKPTIPTVPTTVSSFTNDSGYITDYTVTQGDVTTHQAALSITESQISDLDNYLTSETNTVLQIVGNTLRYTDETGTNTDIDLSLYLDDTNLSRLISGSLDANGTATFTRDDDSTFTVDFSQFFDDTNLARITSAAFNTTDGVLTLTRDDATTITADLDGRYLTSHQDISGKADLSGDTFTGKVIYTGRTTDSGGTSAYVAADATLTRYMSNVATEYHSGASGEPVTLYFKSGVNAPSDFGYITFDPKRDTATEKAELVIGCQNDGNSSSGPDRVKIASPLVIDSKLISSDHTKIVEFHFNGVEKGYITTAGNLQLDGTITASGYNKSNWDTAHGWGDHSIQGYLTSLPSHNHDDRYYTESESDSRFARVHKGTATINTSYTTVATISGDRLASSIDMTIQGTSGNVVINVDAKILVNHSQDILIKTESGIYTQIQIKVTSNSNESYAIEVARVGGSGDTGVAIEIFPRNSETVTFTSSHSFTGSSLNHQTYVGTKQTATGGGAYHLVTDGNISSQTYEIDGTTVIDSSRNLTNIQSLSLNGSDGAIKQSTDTNKNLIIGSANTALRFINNSNQRRIIPRDLDDTAENGTIDLGDSGSKFRALYLSGGIYNAGSNVLDSSNNLVNIAKLDMSGNAIRSNTEFAFLTLSNSAQTAQMGGLGIGSSYSGYPAFTGGVNVQNGYQVGGNTAIDSSRNGTFANVTANGEIISQYGGQVMGVFKGHPNDNHMITIRGNVTGDVTAPTFDDGHQTCFVEFMSPRNDTTGWFFKDSYNNGAYTYSTIAQINTNGINAVQGGFRINSTTVIDSSRNLVNIDDASIGTGSARFTRYTSANLAVPDLQFYEGGKTGWGIGDELGKIRWYIADGSGIGSRDAVRIIPVCETGNGTSTTTFSGGLAFHTSAYNAQPRETIRFDSNGNLNVKIGSYQVNGTPVIDAAKKLTNISGLDITSATGNITFVNSGTTKRGVYGTMGDNDQWFIGGGASSSNVGYLEISTGDDGQTAGGGEEILVRQYGPGTPLTGSLVRTLKLLDTNGNTLIPQQLNMGGNVHMERAGYITFYGDNSTQHSICSRNTTGAASDDIRINSYGSIILNLDSNNNQTSTADFRVGKHGGGDGGVDNLFTLSGESGKINMYDHSALSSFTYINFNNDTGTTVYGRIYRNYSSLIYSTSSDYRLKENVVDLTNASARVNQLPVKRFNFIEHPDRTVDGFLAHEVQDIVPEAVVGEYNEVDENGDPVYQGIDQSKLVPLLTAGLQEALASLEASKIEIENLKARVSALEN